MDNPQITEEFINHKYKKYKHKYLTLKSQQGTGCRLGFLGIGERCKPDEICQEKRGIVVGTHCVKKPELTGITCIIS